ncbi:PIN domain-containing protein [Candidatus Daviesbacteria bacterium]|nr:PIN domain-containing protein [Candidatus Daviesbacteria bacterium]
MTKYLPDTNIFIRTATGDESESHFLRTAIEKKQLVISVIVAGEFLAKAAPDEGQQFNKLLAQFKTLDIDIEVARQASLYRKESLKSTRVAIMDCFLAAQAKLNHLTLVTNNRADFPMKDIKVISP